jgi:NADH-quinone oxidoreductase subunit J
MGSFIVFAILAVIALGAAVGMVLSRNAVHSALFLILNMATLAVFYLVLNAPFIAMVQIAVYAGAIMVLFLFVIMLLGAERLEGVAATGGIQLYLSLFLAGLLLVVIGTSLVLTQSGALETADAIDAGPAAVGLRLFESYVFPFEVTSVLLLVAMVGVLVLRTRRGQQSKEQN